MSSAASAPTPSPRSKAASAPSTAPLELPGRNPLKDAHSALNAAVLAAYGFDPRSDLLAQLLHLNRVVASRERSNHPVTAPGVPPAYGDPSPLITPDCIRP